MDFKELNIAPAILRALDEEGYTAPTPIQEEAIPPILEGRDVLGCAQTGTGKTAAFAVPTLQRLGAQTGGNRAIRALVLTPTRELALQIGECFRSYGKYTRIVSCVIFGGVAQGPQTDALKRGTDILVATPGRLWDLMQQGFVSLRQVEILILDEADRMLDMGFIHDVKRIIAKTPDIRQTLLFSATMPGEISGLACSLLRDPVQVSVSPPASTVDVVEQSVYFVDKANKRMLLVHLLRTGHMNGALVFTRTKHGADRVVHDLTHAGIDAKAIHGDKSQNARQNALNAFKRGEVRVLVATDIAARGIDIEELPYVVNFDLPNIPETYVHRIGRTGRAGLGGTAISFCDITEKPYLSDIVKLICKEIPEQKEHPFPMEVLVPPPKEPKAPRPPRRRMPETVQKKAPPVSTFGKPSGYSKPSTFGKPSASGRSASGGKPHAHKGGRRP